MRFALTMLALSAFLTSPLVHAQTKNLLPISQPHGLESFQIDASGKVLVSKDLWVEEASDKSRTLYAGLGDSLKDSRVEVGYDAQKLPMHVISVAKEDRVPGFWSGLGDAVLKNKYRSAPSEMIVSDLAPDGTLKSETRCQYGNCFNITPNYCKQFLDASGQPTFEKLVQNLQACGTAEKAWSKIVADPKIKQELTETYQNNLKKVSQSLLIPKSGLWDSGLTKNMRATVYEGTQAGLITAVATVCGRHYARGAFRSGAGSPPPPTGSPDARQ